MNTAKPVTDYPGRIRNFKEVTNISEFVEFVLPYGLAKVYMTANRRWSFLNKERRRLALAHLMNRVIRKFAFNLWDVQSARGGLMEDFHTLPVISIINILTTEYAKQENLIHESSNLNMATFKLCGDEIIPTELKLRIEELYRLKVQREKRIRPPKGKRANKPYLYEEAISTLYELEEMLIAHHKLKNIPAIKKTA